jgi:diadenosine tetraphosphate (Ap4A) HIT family hydrolase
MSAALEPCAFCQIAPDAIDLENDLAFAIPVGFPVTPLHALVIPKRHVPNYFSLTETELLACYELLRLLRAKTLAGICLCMALILGSTPVQ